MEWRWRGEEKAYVFTLRNSADDSTLYLNKKTRWMSESGWMADDRKELDLTLTCPVVLRGVDKHLIYKQVNFRKQVCPEARKRQTLKLSFSLNMEWYSETLSMGTCICPQGAQSCFHFTRQREGVTQNVHMLSKYGYLVQRDSHKLTPDLGFEIGRFKNIKTQDVPVTSLHRLKSCMISGYPTASFSYHPHSCLPVL